MRLVDEPRGRCTGIAASWCPLHGECTCPRGPDGAIPEGGLNDPSCPLHATTSLHAEGR